MTKDEGRAAAKLARNLVGCVEKLPVLHRVAVAGGIRVIKERQGHEGGGPAGRTVAHPLLRAIVPLARLEYQHSRIVGAVDRQPMKESSLTCNTPPFTTQ